MFIALGTMADLPYAWLGDVQTFVTTSEENLLRHLTAFTLETGAPQVLAWDRTVRALREQLAACLPGAANFALVLEFELPRGCHGRELIPVLVPIGMVEASFERRGVHVVGPHGRGALIRMLAKAHAGQ